MERLLRKKEYLKTIFSSHASSEDGQHLLQKPSREVNSNIKTPRLYFIYSKANNQALFKAKTRTPSKKQYKIYQIMVTSIMLPRQQIFFLL